MGAAVRGVSLKNTILHKKLIKEDIKENRKKRGNDGSVNPDGSGGSGDSDPRGPMRPMVCWITVNGKCFDGKERLIKEDIKENRKKEDIKVNRKKRCWIMVGNKCLDGQERSIKE